MDVQREATHYKNRVLDLLDDYVKKQPTNSLVLRLVLPLVELATTSGPDERQLSDKATSMLRSRFGKSKDIPLNINGDQAFEILKVLHVRARKAISADVLTTLSQCSLFVTKCLVQAQQEEFVVEVYRESLRDFVSRKASRLNTPFFHDFIRRYPHIAWNLRTDFFDVLDDAVNGYRQAQIFVLFQVMLGHLHSFVSLFQLSVRITILRIPSRTIKGTKCERSFHHFVRQYRNVFELRAKTNI